MLGGTCNSNGQERTIKVERQQEVLTEGEREGELNGALRNSDCLAGFPLWGKPFYCGLLSKEHRTGRIGAKGVVSFKRLPSGIEADDTRLVASDGIYEPVCKSVCTLKEIWNFRSERL